MRKIESSNTENKGRQVNQKDDEKEVKRIKQLLDDMLDFLAEMSVDKHHDYRGFRNLRLREYLVHKYMQKKSAQKVTRRKNN